MKYKNLMCSGTIRFLHKFFARFGILDTIVLDNGTQFAAKEFKDFYKVFLIIHITTAPYHARFNWQAESFLDTFKWALKMSDGNESVDNILQFLRVYHTTLNPSTN